MREAILSLKNERVSDGQHPGLLLQRYLCEKATGEEGNPEEKRAILQAAMNAAQHDEVRSLYRATFERWSTSLPTDSKHVELQTTARLIVGLGSENVLETGIRLHHTYGMPIIPGSALKGLAAHYCDQIWGQENPQFKKPKQEEGERDNYHRLLFGTTDDSGCIMFHDAWYVPDSSVHPLALDVMTPHHPNFQHGPENPKFKPPTDFDSPRPVSFLSVTGTFYIVVSWNGPASDQSQCWTNVALALLKQALADWGIGGKTSSGYGRLIEKSGSVEKTGAKTATPMSATTKTFTSPQKRNSGTAVRVKVIGTREKGYDVQEEGKAQGTLTVGKKPEDVSVDVGQEIEVEVHDDDPRKPQYRWPSPKPARKKPTKGKPSR